MMGETRVVMLAGCLDTRRGAGFLLMPEERFVNAYDEFLGFDDKTQSRLWTSFRYWISEIRLNIPGICHGYNQTDHNGKYVNCFQFELHNGRFYGFLSHPDDKNSKLIYFTAIHYLKKHYYKTEITVLERIKALSQSERVKLAEKKPISIP